MLQISDLRKKFGDFVAVDGVSFAVARGESVGLLGPNGAGKTTTVSMICGLLRPDGGTVLVDGGEVRSDTAPAKRKVGLVPQDLALFEELTAAANLSIFGSLYGLKGGPLAAAIASALGLVGLGDRARHRVKTFSGGMKRRLNLASALLHDPDLLILDEPTVGVDPQSRNAIFDNLETLKSRGKALLYTTHYMEEAERLCDRIVIIDKGRVVADDTLRGLYGRLPARNRIAIELEDDADAGSVEGLRAIPGVRAVDLSPGRIVLGADDLNSAAPAIFAWLGANGIRFAHAETERPDLESVFLTLTGRSLRDS